MEQEGCSALCFLPALHHGPLKVLWKSGLLKSVPFSQTAALGSGFVKDNARAHFLSLVSLGTIIKNRMILKSGGKPPEWQTSDCAWSLDRVRSGSTHWGRFGRLLGLHWRTGALGVPGACQLAVLARRQHCHKAVRDLRGVIHQWPNGASFGFVKQKSTAERCQER